MLAPGAPGAPVAPLTPEEPYTEKIALGYTHAEKMLELHLRPLNMDISASDFILIRGHPISLQGWGQFSQLFSLLQSLV